MYAHVTRVLAIAAYPITSVMLHNSKRVRVLVEYKGQILLQRSSIGHQRWSLPGGGVEKGENPFAAAVREVQEETAVLIPENKLTCLGERRITARLGWPSIDVLFYVAQLNSYQEPRIIRPAEILEVQWFKTAEIPKKHSDSIDIAYEMCSASKNT